MTIEYLEDIKPGSVRETGTYTVTEEEIIRFARDYDPQYFHIDPEAAKKSIFGGIIASGWHTCALTMKLMVAAFVNNRAGRGSPGFDELRWIKPLRPNDTIKVRSTCLEIRPSRSKPNMGSAHFLTEVVNQSGDVIMSMKSIGMYDRRPGTY